MEIVKGDSKNLLTTKHYRQRRLNKILVNFTFGLIVSTICTNMLALSVQAQPEQAHSAEEFIDTMGVNTHLYFGDTIYGPRYEDLIKPKLVELGFRYIRDGLVKNPEYYDRLRDMASLGIRANVIFSPYDTSPQEGAEIVKELGSNVIASVQGANEPDLNFGELTSDWAGLTRDYQQKLYQAIKRDNGTKDIPVLGPSLTSKESFDLIGDLSQYMDYGVMHNYFSGRHPGTGAYGSDGYGTIKWNVDLANQYSGSEPVVSTETGYQNRDKPTRNWDDESISESASAKYIPRIFLEHFNNGVSRTYIFELIDTNFNPEQPKYGLLRNDGSEKPVFVALKNLVSLLKDPGANFTPGVLDYELSGNTTNVHHTLLQKRDKKFYLILWQEVPSFEVTEKREIDVASQKVTLTLKTPIAKAITYLPNLATTLVKQETYPKQIELNVPDYPLVVELEPR